ncbi:glutathione S-transferase family protein [Maricaulis sp.]|uniref:glutathione S-transferase family protein n=1 Tax=Maricaulis sp. TaxID=1486257 RepID=UPI001B017DBF|nr:glutathione S-transferase family protein [Maricaulis sp.]MBO6796941.1 glutathione S-transferase family protein [Maricaulis sp.]
MSEYKLYYCPQTRCRTALWMLEEVGAPYKLVPVNVRNEIESEAFAAVSPMRKVPALQIGDELITETAAICLYLADAHPDAGLTPAIGEAGRASLMRWMFFGSAVMEPASFDKATGRDAPAGAIGWGNWERVLETLRQGLERKSYLVNDRFSAADIALGSTMSFLMNFNMMEKDPLFVSYVERLTARPAFIKASEIDASHAEPA